MHVETHTFSVWKWLLLSLHSFDLGCEQDSKFILLELQIFIVLLLEVSGPSLILFLKLLMVFGQRFIHTFDNGLVLGTMATQELIEN